MKAVLAKSAVVAAVLAVVLVPEAQAAGGEVSGSCRSGTLSGTFAVTYDTVGTTHRLRGVRGGAGPYIGDSGSLRFRVAHTSSLGVERQVYGKAWTGVPSGQRNYDLPDNVSMPTEGTGHATMAFTGGGFTCTAKATIR